MRTIEAQKAAVRGLLHASTDHARLARLQYMAGEKEAARAVLHDAMQVGGGGPEDFEAIAFAAFTLNDHRLALEAYTRVASLLPQDGLARYNLASAYRNLGMLDRAEEAADAALARDGRLFQAALLRSQLRTQLPGDNHVAELKERLRRHGDDLPAQIFLNYAIGKEIEDLGRYDEAFAYFAAGAGARRRSMSYSVDRDLAIFGRLAEVYDRTRITEWRASEEGRGYGFVLGLPRSGTTLIERVLTGHPGVRSNGETDNFSTALLAAVAPGKEDIFTRSARSNSTAIGRHYRRLARSTDPATTLVLEKLPLNFLYVGAIAMALPGAPIVLLRRNLVDNCLAMFTTLFAAAYPFSYDLDELARYVAGYTRLMDHWQRAMPSALLAVSYEDFVEDPTAQGPAIAAHCGIAWAPESIHIERNASASTTASAVQIRQPIYTSALHRWRRYAKQLAPLIERLRMLDVPVAD